MSETQDPTDRALPDRLPERLEYQPPAIAWEEPLHAIAASTCALVDGENGCQGAVSLVPF